MTPGWGHRHRAIPTGDEDTVVEMNELGEKLTKEIENDVQVTSIVTEDPDGKNRILVTGSELLNLQDAFNNDYNPDDGVRSAAGLD